MVGPILGPLEKVANSQRVISWPKRRNPSKLADPDSRVRPMLNILARSIFQLIPVACPDPPVDGDLILINQDLAGFFTSIDQARFIDAWHMLLDFLSPHMNVGENEAFSVYPGKSNNPGDIIKGRTFQRLNVTRKIGIKDVPSLIKTALDMQTFTLGNRCIRQRRGSPMGSPVSPALCLMVVSITEQIWSINLTRKKKPPERSRDQKGKEKERKKEQP